MIIAHQFGILLALCCAAVSNLAFFLKQRGASSAPAIQARRPLRSAKALLGTRWFALGMVAAVIAWLLHVAAMALAPLSCVQVVLAGGVVLIGVMAGRGFGFDVHRRQWLGLTLAAVGLAAFALTAPSIRGAHSAFAPGAMAAFEGALCVAAGLLLLACPRAGTPGRHHGTMLGAASGILFGASDVALKALTGIVSAHGVLGLISPVTATAVLASVVAFYASAASFQRGDAVTVISITSTSANLSAIGGGVLVFGDPLAGSALGVVTQSLGLVALLLAAAVMPTLGLRSHAGAAPAAA